MLTLNTGNQVPVDLEIVCIHRRYGGDGDVIKDDDAEYILETKVMFAIIISNAETKSYSWARQQYQQFYLVIHHFMT